MSQSFLFLIMKGHASGTVQTEPGGNTKMSRSFIRLERRQSDQVVGWKAGQ
ncbi:hypothetical protein PCH70_50250 [Pseudomonas cichorii JBC1]|nr:hypothetical protein PCH70_50250 [Pseudomonas cichorii JBC1]